MRFETQQRPQLFGGIFDIDTLVAGQAVWNPVESMQAHDVIDAKQLRIPEVILKILDDVAITIQPHRLGIHRRESPVLPLRENRVRGSASGDALNEKIGMPPIVIPRAIQTQW